MITLFGNLKLYLIVGLTAVVIGSIGYLKLSLDAAQADSERYKLEAETAQKRINDLTASLNAMQEMAKAVDGILAEREKARLKAERDAAIARSKYQSLTREIANENPNSCLMQPVDNGILDWVRESTGLQPH